jgi:hypothetical protein
MNPLPVERELDIKTLLNSQANTSPASYPQMDP